MANRGRNKGHDYTNIAVDMPNGVTYLGTYRGDLEDAIARKRTIRFTGGTLMYPTGAPRDEFNTPEGLEFCDDNCTNGTRQPPVRINLGPAVAIHFFGIHSHR